MPAKFIATFLACAGLLIGAGLRARAEDKPKINYKDHVAGLFQAKCNACHNNDKKKGGLALDTFAGVMQGGGSGAVVEPGDPDGSRLYLLSAHQEEPKMPPNAPKIPDAELATIKAWIEAGAPETSGSAVAVKAKPKLDFKLDPAAMGKPQGPPAMPEGVLTEVFVSSPRPNAITALAASPWAPLVAIAGHKQVLLYNTQSRHLSGVLPFPEGTIYCLKFSRDGGMLLAAGGHGAEKGLAVAFDVKTGKRLFEVGKEYDVALGADISPDRTLVALGGPGKMLRVYNTSDGELAYECKKHTDWVTAIEFSPDGALLASGDRNGGLVVWEANTGREFNDLRGHTAMVTDVSWRLDSNILASCGEDGTIRLWELENGNNVKNWGAHGGGAESVRFAKDGRLASTGRDRVTKLWDQNGGQQKAFEGFNDLGLRAVFAHDDTAILAGDFTGEVRMWELKEGTRLATFTANPAPLAVRLEQASAVWTQAQAAADAGARELAALQADALAKTTALTAAQQAQAAAEQAVAKATSEQQAAEQAHAQKAAVADAAGNVLWSARNVEERALAVKVAADQALNEAIAAATAATGVQNTTKTERDKVVADKAAAAKTTATTTAEAAAVQLAAAVAASQAAKPAADTANTERDAIGARLPEIRKTAQDAANALNAARAQLAAATPAKAAADKALADKTPAVQALTAQATALKAEVDALTVEKKASDAAKATTTAATS